MQLAIAVALALAAQAVEPDDATAKPTPDTAAAEQAQTDAMKKDASARPTVRVGVDVGAYRDSVGVSVLTPSVHGAIEDASGEWAVSGQYLLDMVSAASPDIVTTASPNFKELRHGGSLGGYYKPNTFQIGANANVSYSNDYLAVIGGVSASKELDEKNLTLLLGYAYGHDTIGRTDTPFSVFSRKLDYHNIDFGFSKLINPSAVITVTGDVIIERGDQSKPYRYIPVFAPEVGLQLSRGATPDEVANARTNARPLEQLPLKRDRYALTGKLAWRLGGTTLRLDERGYIDTWEIVASTTDAKLVVDVAPRVAVWPHARFHIQNGASFYKRAYYSQGVDDLPALRTSDRELSPLLSGALGGGTRISLGKPGSVDDLLLTFGADGTYTDFLDALLVKDRWAVLLTAGVEAVF